MGLHLNFELRLPGDTPEEDVDRMLAALQARAMEIPFRELTSVDAIAPAHDVEGRRWVRMWADIIARPFEDDRLIGDPATARAFLVNPGIGCETATFGFLARASADGKRREWFWYCGCKTQYAATVSDDHLVFCHTSLVALLDYAIELGIDVVVRDETHFWETRSPERLVEEVRAMNRIIASFAGALSDAMGDEHRLQAPIFGHPRFERLEMGEEG